MAPRRGAPSSNTLSPQDSMAHPGPPSPVFPGFPRSTSPSSGFTQFLSRPAKWFNRSASASKLPAGVAEPRASTSSGRRHKISHPTDPRPILDNYAVGASKSVLDLSARPPVSLDMSPFHPPSTPSSPITAPNSAGLGDLRSISRKGWSKSVDDLGKVSSSSFSPIKTSFHNKVVEYRNRSDSNASVISPSSPTSSGSILNGRHPFPSVQGSSSPSSSPPRSTTLPPVSISISAPELDEGPPVKTSNPTHVHTRSHSFTPKLSSKLATPRFIPPSPKRKGSGASERDAEVKEPERPAGQAPGRGGFGFGFGGLTAKSSGSNDNVSAQAPTGHRTTTLLAPPTIVEPGEEDDNGTITKRSSQIVFHSGFINRLADVPNHFHHTNLALAKGWKPFKLELKGSKLYFYKPPGDRIASAKELFPTEFVPASPEDDDDEAETGPRDEREGGPPRRGHDGGTYGRKRRAFWGRRTHPDLIQAGDKVDKGTFEALVHEAVFATTFPQPSDNADGHRENWKDFASSIILCLPSLVGRSRFEAELLRCCEFLISGSEESAKENERSRVGWLAGEYLRYHGSPVDLVAWEDWRRESIPDIASGIVQVPNSNGITSSASMQALYLPSPLLGSGSPNLGTFSPRPQDGAKYVSLVEALGGSLPLPSSGNTSIDFWAMEHQQSHASISRMPWAALDREGLSRDVLLLLDPHLIARSLLLFHRSMLERTPDNLTAEFVMGSDFQAQSDVPDLAALSFEPLFGSEEQPHWLTKLLLIQILGADTSGGNTTVPQLASPGRKSEDRNTQTSRTHSRSEVISVWAKVAELCRAAGDECSWRAISAALCSRPVARLDKAWKRVDPLALAAIESWVYPGDDGETVSVKEPKVTPWGGEIKHRIKEELAKARGENGDQILRVDSLEITRTLFEDFRTSFSLCPRRVNVDDGDVGDDVRKLVAYWRDMSAEGGGTGSLAAKFRRIEQFMSLSLAAEPRRKGLFEPYFWSRSPSGHAPHVSLLPLLFPESLPAIGFVDRAQLLRGRVDSDVSDVQFLRGIDTQFRPSDRRNLRGSEANMDSASALAVLGRGGTVIPVYNGDLLLVVQHQNDGSDSVAGSRPSSRAPSRPPSSVVDTEKTLGRAPSIRVKPGSSQGLERKPSAARRNSLPSLSQRQNLVMSEPSSEPPLRVLVQAGTLSTLVDILVHGLRNVSVSVADDNGEMSLREGKTRELVVDHAEFAKVWWNVFRSFVMPLVFFELLRKRYIAAQAVGSSPSVSEYLHVTGSRIEVLETIKSWIAVGGGAQDMLDDIQLYNAVRSFVDSHTDHQVYEAANLEDPHVRQAWAGLADARRSLSSSFIAQTMRPTVARNAPIPRLTSEGARKRNIGAREPPDIDQIDPEELVDNLDVMACAAFSNVTEEDLYVTADLLEVQTSDRTGWFSLREISSMEETVEIQTIYSHIQEVEPSSMISDLTQDAIYRLLPPGIRSCIRAYGILRKWLISKIVAPRLGLRARQARMELLLQAIEVARLRNSEPTSTLRLVDQSCVRSFVETVVTSAILSVESRMHHKAWQNVAANRGSQCDSLASLLSRPYTKATSSREPLTVDMGWLLERMLEVIASSDIIEPALQENQSLVNFDKRRHLCNLITKAPYLPSARRRPKSDEIHRRGFERLNNVEKDVFLLQFDPRGIKEEAVREATQAVVNGLASAKKVARPFQRVVAAQIEKNRRDKNLRSRLQKEKLHEQTRNEKRDDLLNKAMRPRKPGTNVPKQHRNKKSMSAFLHFMRPISSAFGAEIPHLPGVRKTPSELDFTPSGKPSLVLSLMDAQVAQFINNERSFTFQLDTEDGGHYLLQAMNKRDMQKWIDVINRCTKMAAKRRLTYLGNSPKPQLSDHIHNHPATASRDPTAVFGVELEFLLQRESGGAAVLPGTIPSVMEQCLSEIESRGLSEVGIYRIAGATSEINSLKDSYNQGETPITKATDIHAVCDLVKSWFRVLPEPVFPSSSYHDIIRSMQLENLDERLSSIRSVVQALPQPNFDLLRRVSEHLDKVTDFEEHNHMTAEALAIVFSPNLLRAPQNDFVMILSNMGHTHKLVKALITHFHVIFDDADPEAEVHSEDEYDSPILEEDEEEEGEDQDDIRAPQADGQDQFIAGYEHQYTPS